MVTRVKSRKTAVVVICILTVLFAMAFGAINVDALSVKTAKGKVNSSEGAYLRKSASTGSKAVTILKDNTSVTISKEVFTSAKNHTAKNKWYYVTAGEKKGYIRSDLVDSISYDSVKGKVASALNYRKGAGVKMNKVGTFKKNAAVEIVMTATANDSDVNWYKIKKDGKYYYVSSRWIKLAASVSTAPEVRLSSSGMTYPEKITEKSPFSLRGIISCNEKITGADVGVLDGKGNWVIKVSKKVNSDTFDIKDVDSEIRFATLPVGTYTYKVNVQVRNKTYTQLEKSFNVVKMSKAEKIADKAFEIAWPVGTAKSVYSYSTGKPTDAYAEALNAAYPNRSKWGEPPRAGASCDVCAGTILRASGVDKSVPRGLAEQFPYFDESDKYTKVDYDGDRNDLRSGDIILYKREGSSGAHICIYLKKNGKEYIAEANYNSTYAMLLNSTSALNIRLRVNDKIKMGVYRIIEN